MDLWGQENRPRHKRSHAEMSQQATLSPSPIIFRGPSPSSFASVSRYSTSIPSNENIPTFFDRRRTSHPHNPPINPFQASTEDMPDRSQSQQRPRLEHRASQTLIDLTEDNDEVPFSVWNRPPSLRPPQLGRSDAQGLADVIDLTDDDTEIQITGSRNRELPLPRPGVPRPAPRLHFARGESPSLFMPRHPPPPPRDLNRVFPAGGFGVVLGGGRHSVHLHGLIHDGMGMEMFERFAMMEHIPAMPGQMDYRHAAFADRKPDRVPPEPAKPGFTRSPTEKDTVICPSCEEELVHRKNAEEPVLKKGGKAPTRKEREEHPFWVIKECGHVYCNNCYQNRIPSSKQPGSVSFPERPSTGKGSKKVPMCAVEDCASEAKNKDKWVGVFL